MVSCLPAILIGLPFDDFIEKKFNNWFVVAVMLIVYGVLFLVVEDYNEKRTVKIHSIADITWKTALLIGIFQVLALIPGTSRSGATIIGGILLGASRTVAAEYTFFLAIPVMFGASLLKIVKFGFDFTSWELTILGVGTVVSSRTVAAEYTFFLAIPVMFGASLLKIVKFGFDFTSWELTILGVGTVVSFVVSILAIKKIWI